MNADQFHLAGGTDSMVRNSDLERSAMPRHEHDCTTCVFLGRHGRFDLYLHDGGDHPAWTTVIARWGSLGSYSSGLWAARPYVSIDGQQQSGIPELVEARNRAIAMGFGAVIDRAEGRATQPTKGKAS